MGKLPITLFAFYGLAACSFAPGAMGPRDGNGGPTDADADAMADAIPDAAVCPQAGEASCVGDTLRTCTAVGQTPTDQACAWGCTGTAPSAKCAELAPSGGWETAVTGDTTDFTGLMDITLPDGAVVNGANGSISGAGGSGTFRAAGLTTISGIDYELRALGTTGRMVAVFRVKKLTISNLSLIGTYAIAFVADDGIDVSGIIDAVPACDFTDTRTPGPGGFAGGLNNFDGSPAPPGGGGKHGPGNDDGGGGGGYGATGGDGGNNGSSGGASFGDATISLLEGGGGGGGGDNHANSGHGGGGGAAIHLLATGPIVFTAGGLNAGGCGGRAGQGSNDGGGGGGAGGAILIEAPTVTIAGALAVNGGGGGGGNVGSNNTVGQKGQLSRTPATGGPAGNGSAGGAGGAGGGSLDGSAGTNGSGGGGGGAVGRIRINTRAGTADIAGATLSPSPTDTGTTYSEGVAATR